MKDSVYSICVVKANRDAHFCVCTISGSIHKKAITIDCVGRELSGREIKVGRT